MSALPVLSGVKPHTIELFLRLVADEGANLAATDFSTVKISRTKGRCIEVLAPAPLPSWMVCAAFLLGGLGRPCEEFRRVGAYGVVARLKSAEQTAADAAAFTIDEARGELETYLDPYPVEHAVGGPGLREQLAKKPRKSAAPVEGVGGQILAHVDGPTKMLDLIALVKTEMSEKLDKRGRDRREEVIRDRLKALAKSGHVVISADEDTVSLPGGDE